MSTTVQQAPDATAIRPFQVEVPQMEIDELRRRIAATRWPDEETVDDGSQGTRLATLQELVRHWGADYDWRRFEARLNALPQFVTNLDGLDIHFLHVRSPHPNALALIMTHGWPGSIVELLDTVNQLTDPTAHGGRAEDAFDLVLPSMPGFGFSEKPVSPDWGPDRIGRAWAELMNRLGYTRYVAQGGDWGAVVTEAMGRQAPAGLLGIHVNLPAAVPADVAMALAAGGPAPSGLSDEERATFDKLSTTAKTLYWLTNTGTSAGRLYWENGGADPNSAAAQRTTEISLPVAITVFPGESYQAPRSWAERAYPNLTYFNNVGSGGHFAAWEEPELFSAELRAAFNSLR
jgi:pimeloyl-ACP methyl ester carboxylesterase